MEAVPVKIVPRGFGETSRRDAWWVEPLVVFVVLGRSSSTRRGRRSRTRTTTFGPYLSPFYSPVLFGDSPHAWFGPKPAWWPALLPFSPALLILPFPGLFRFTCYYYRGAYYKAFWADPPACAVGEPRKGYLRRALVPADPAERPPLLLLHRGRLPRSSSSYDVWLALWFADPATGGSEFGIGVGTLVLAVNVVLLAQLHARLPLAPAPRRRPQGRGLEVAGR